MKPLSFSVRPLYVAVTALFIHAVALAQAPVPTPPSPAPAPAASTAPAPAASTAPAPAAAPATTDQRSDAATASEPAPTPPKRDTNERTNRVERVDVTGKNNATDERRNSSAAKIVISRQDIEQFGDSNLGDTMRRLPGVTSGGRPGRAGPPQMRGMGGGFTQILLDGQRIPPGFSIEQLSPDQVERIEIFRAPTAETGTRAVAGTINIILREPLRQTNNDVRVALNSERGKVVPEVSITRNDSINEALTYNVTGTYRTRHQLNDSESRITYVDTRNGQTTLDDLTKTQSVERGENFFGNGRLQWRLGNGEQFGIQALGGHSTTDTRTSSNLTEFVGPGAPYALSNSAFDGSVDFARIGANLNKRFNETLRYELRAGFGSFSSDNALRVNQFDALALPLRVQTTDSSTRDKSWQTAGKVTYNSTSEPSHAITSGWEVEGLKRRENALTLLNGVQQLADLGTQFNVSTLRYAMYLQDEWDPAPNWSANLGLRYEQIETKSSTAGDTFVNTSRVLSPLGHVVWRFSAPSRDQLRLSLTQSYRSPQTQQLTARPSLSVAYPVPGANIFTSPDRAGNPNLKPERANGIDLAYEHYLKSGGVMSVNLFGRDIKDVIRNVTALEDVSWASVDRYVNRPQNLGKARTYGIELDAKFRLSELFDDIGELGRLSVKMNGSFYNSHVASVQGPDNRIDGQPAFTGNFGLDYRFTNSPLALGGNLGYTPSYEVQLTDALRQTLSTKRVFDAYAVWNFNSTTRLRLSVSNIAPLDSTTTNVNVDGPIRQTTVSNARTDVNYALRFEVRL